MAASLVATPLGASYGRNEDAKERVMQIRQNFWPLVQLMLIVVMLVSVNTGLYLALRHMLR